MSPEMTEDCRDVDNIEIIGMSAEVEYRDTKKYISNEFVSTGDLMQQNKG